MDLHRRGEIVALLDFSAYCVDCGCELLVLLSLGENFETLHERNARIDHDGELASENRDVFRCRVSPEFHLLQSIQGADTLLLFSIQQRDLLAPEGKRQSLTAVGHPFTRNV